MAERPNQPTRAAQAGFGTLLRAHRTRMPLTQEELAERAGLSERTLRNLEAGRIHRPYPDTIRRLADALNLTGEERQDFEGTARQVTVGSATTAVGSRSGPLGPVPCQLPPDAADFTGRSEQITLVRNLLAGTAADRAPTAVVVSAVAARPGSARPRSPSTSPTSCGASSRTASCTSTCTAPPSIRLRRPWCWPGSCGPLA